ncbi:MAG: hypothetical protein IT429_10920 [Gemmataceae bacterium]|nr:hypothetical protein [Gemmataceae bacterium]
MSFLLWRDAYEEGFCKVNAPQGIERLFELSRGVSRAAGFPDDAYCEMDADYPKDIQLSDNLYGTSYAIVSLRLRQELEKAGVANVEFLPIKILNHKGRVASKDYFLMNPLTVCDCIDVDKSGVKWNAIAKDKISRCAGLVLRADQVPPDCRMFRPKFWTNLILVRTELADQLSAAGLLGLVFRKPQTYKGIG